MRLEVSGSGYDSAADALYTANQTAAIAYDSLTGKLGGYTALGGDDTSSEDFVREYDASAQEAVHAMRSLVTGLGNLGDVVTASIGNHREANAASVYNKPRPTYDGGPTGDGPVQVAGFTPPSSLGGDNDDMPDWWNHVVDHLQGWGWPSANTDQLRSAAAAWRSAGSAVGGLTSPLDSALSQLEAQRSPEIAVASKILRTTRTNISDLATCLTDQGDACEDYATQVDQTRQTIKDLLRDLAIECAATGVISVGLSFVTFGGAAVAGAAVIAARAVKYAVRILAALKALRAARAVLKVAKNAPKLGRVRQALDNLKTARSLVKMKTIPKPKLKTSPKQLQKKYEKHAKDFGVQGNYNPANGQKFGKAIDDFLGAPGTTSRTGTYLGNPATLSFNPTTGRVVVLQPDGTFVTGFKMNYQQLQNVIRIGKLGGH